MKDFLDAIIITAIALLITMLTVPPNLVWKEEERNRELRREKMEIINDAQNFYYSLLGEYTLDSDELFYVVESVLDSTIADPNYFLGQEKVLNRYTIEMNQIPDDIQQGDIVSIEYDFPNGECFIDLYNGVYDEGEDFVDLGNGVYDVGESFIDKKNGKYDEGEEFTDKKNGKYDLGEKFTDGNGKWDEGEKFKDGDGIWNPGEVFIDINGKYDEGEFFIDLKNGVYDEGEKFEDGKNGKYDEGEKFTDSGNKVYDQGQDLFIDLKNGKYDIGEKFIDSMNGKYDGGEKFTDLNGNDKWDINEPFEDEKNGIYDDGDKFVFMPGYNEKVWVAKEFFYDGDLKYTAGDDCICELNIYNKYQIPENCKECYIDGNGRWDEGEAFEDGNGKWDEGEEFVDIENGKWDLNEIFIDSRNGRYDEGEAFIDLKNGKYDLGEKFEDYKDGVWNPGELFIDGNGKWDEEEPFIDGNGKWDEGESFIDSKNGLYDLGEEFADEKNGKYDYYSNEIKGIVNLESGECSLPIMKVVSINDNVINLHSFNKLKLDADRNGSEFDINKNTQNKINYPTKKIKKTDYVKNSLKRKRYVLNVELGLGYTIDTTFSYPVELENNKTRELYKIEVQNELDKQKRDDLWVDRSDINNYNVFNILKTDMSTSTNVIKDFLLKKYHLESDYALCPISDSNNDKKFIFDIEYEKGSNKQQFIIKAPIDNDDKVSLRYGIFRYRPGKPEEINNGVANW